MSFGGTSQNYDGGAARARTPTSQRVARRTPSALGNATPLQRTREVQGVGRFRNRDYDENGRKRAKDA